MGKLRPREGKYKKESHLNLSLVLQILGECRINTPTYKDGKAGVWGEGGKEDGGGEAELFPVREAHSHPLPRSTGVTK